MRRVHDRPACPRVPSSARRGPRRDEAFVHEGEGTLHLCAVGDVEGRRGAVMHRATKGHVDACSACEADLPAT